MQSSAMVLRNSTADVAATTVFGSIDKRSSGGVTMRPRRGVQFGEASEGSFLGQAVKKNFAQPSGVVRTARRTVVEAPSMLKSKTKVALVRIGTHGWLVPAGLVLDVYCF